MEEAKGLEDHGQGVGQATWSSPHAPGDRPHVRSCPQKTQFAPSAGAPAAPCKAPSPPGWLGRILGSRSALLTQVGSGLTAGLWHLHSMLQLHMCPKTHLIPSLPFGWAYVASIHKSKHVFFV